MHPFHVLSIYSPLLGMHEIKYTCVQESVILHGEEGGGVALHNISKVTVLCENHSF